LLHNPFSTKNTSPGKIPYYFNKGNFSLFHKTVSNVRDNFHTSKDGDLQQLYQGLSYLYSKFSEFEYRSQIIGQHGSGKTTLLVSFMSFLENCNHKIISVILHDNEQKLPKSFWEDYKKTKKWLKTQNEINQKKTPIVVIDGSEQLLASQRRKILQLCTTDRLGILVTTHKPIKQIPVLFQTKTSPEILEMVVNYLLKKNGQTLPFDQSQYFTLLEQHHGNIRDILFSLYDLYE
jgi:DNA replication protein DnaC